MVKINVDENVQYTVEKICNDENSRTSNSMPNVLG